MKIRIDMVTLLLNIFGMSGVSIVSIVLSIFCVCYGIACIKTKKLLFSRYSDSGFSIITIYIISIVTIIIGLIGIGSFLTSLHIL